MQELRSQQAEPTTGERLNDGRAGRRWPWITAVVAAVVLLGVGAWLGFRVLTVKAELEASQAVLTEIRKAGTVTTGLSRLGEHAERASAAANAPVLRASLAESR